MYRYQVSIQGIHCHSCVILLNMCFEDAGMQNVLVNAQQSIVDFESTDEIDGVRSSLSKLFAEDLSGYQFTNLLLKP